MSAIGKFLVKVIGKPISCSSVYFLCTILGEGLNKAVDGFAYVLGHGGFDAMTAAYNGVETPVLIASNIDRYTEDPQAIQDAFFANFTEEQRDTVQATETLISGAVPFSQTIGKVFANPILLLTLVVAAMALWFIGPMFKRVTS